MKKRRAVALGVIALLGPAPIVMLSLHTREASAVSDPRQEPPIVRFATAARVTGSERAFTGVIGGQSAEQSRLPRRR